MSYLLLYPIKNQKTVDKKEKSVYNTYNNYPLTHSSEDEKEQYGGYAITFYRESVPFCFLFILDKKFFIAQNDINRKEFSL